MPRFLLAIAIILIAGCSSNQAVYNDIQRNNQQNCNRVPPPQYDECMERSSQSYDDYERERKALVDDPS